MASVADEEKELETIGNEENEAAKMLTNDDDDEVWNKRMAFILF